MPLYESTAQALLVDPECRLDTIQPIVAGMAITAAAAEAPAEEL